MTTTIKVSAHCSSDKEVKINHTDWEGKDVFIILQDGETYEGVVYDDRSIFVREAMKDTNQ